MIMRLIRSYAIIKKPIIKAEDAIREISSGSSVAIGGFGSCGSPLSLLKSLSQHSHINKLTLICNDVGSDHDARNEKHGISLLIHNNQVNRLVTSYIGESELTIEKYNKGELTIDFVSQVSHLLSLIKTIHSINNNDNNNFLGNIGREITSSRCRNSSILHRSPFKL